VREDESLILQQQLRRFWLRQRSSQPAVEGLSRRASELFGVIYRAAPGVSPSELATQLGQASSNIASGLRELEAAGYITRDRDPDDARRVRVTITASGAAVLDRTRVSRAGWLRELAASTLTPAEQQQLLAAGALLDRMAASPSDEPR